MATTYSFDPVTPFVFEGDGVVTFTIRRQGDLPGEVVFVSTTQTEGSTNQGDYDGLLNAQVVFAAGASTATVQVRILEDLAPEQQQTFGLIVQRNASDPVNTWLGKTTFVIGETLDQVPGDTSTNATLTPGVEGHGRINTIDVSGAAVDTDWYKVTLVGGHQYTLTADENASEAYITDTLTALQVNLRDEFGGLISSMSGVSLAVPLPPIPQTGIYFIEVRAQGGDTTGTYSVLITDTTSGGGNQAPVISGLSNLTFGAGETVQVRSLFSDAFDPEDVEVTRIEIRDNSPGVGGTFLFDGNELSGTIDIQWSQIHRYSFRADSAGTKNIIIEAFDSEGLDSDDLNVSLSVESAYEINPVSRTVSESDGSIIFTVSARGLTEAKTLYVSTVQTVGSPNDGDYTGLENEPILVVPGQSTQVRVLITNDTEFEPDETFALILQEEADDLPRTFLAKANFTIVSDDAAPYSVSPSVLAPGEDTGAVTFTLTRPSSVGEETLYVSTMESEGFTNDGDFAVHRFTPVSFVNGSRTATFSVSLHSDAIVEDHESFGVIVHRSASPQSEQLAKTKFQIRNDDTGGWSIDPLAQTVSEGGLVRFTIARPAGPAQTVYVSTTEDRGDDNDGDYSSVLGQAITFADGQTTREVTVSTLNDTEVEGSEQFGIIVQQSRLDLSSVRLAASEFTIVSDDTSPAPPAAKWSGDNFTDVGGKYYFLAKWAAAAYKLPSDVSSTAAGHYADIGKNVSFLQPHDLPDLDVGQFSDGIYTRSNAAVLVGRAGDTLFISFRGTNDAPFPDADARSEIIAGRGSADQDHWADVDGYFTENPKKIDGAEIEDEGMAEHFALVQPLLIALDEYIERVGIDKVYVTGHSLGAAMVQAYMLSKVALANYAAMYEAVGFASPGYGPQESTANHTNVTNIKVDGDLIDYLQSWLPKFYGNAGRVVVLTHDDANIVTTNEGIGFHDTELYVQAAEYISKALLDTIEGGIEEIQVNLSYDGQWDVTPPNGGNSSSRAEIIMTEAGGDRVAGGGGGDVISVEGGGDIALGEEGNDKLVAGSGTGDDFYDGGPDIDTISYESTIRGVRVDLSATQDHGTGIEIDTDQIFNVENVVGGSGDDVITGDDFDNFIDGKGGNDVIDGRGGRDAGRLDLTHLAVDIDFRLDQATTTVQELPGGASFVNFEEMEIALGAGDDRAAVEWEATGEALTLFGGGGVDELAVDWAAADGIFFSGDEGLNVAVSASDGELGRTLNAHEFELIKITGGTGSDFFQGRRVGNELIRGGSGRDFFYSFNPIGFADDPLPVTHDEFYGEDGDDIFTFFSMGVAGATTLFDGGTGIDRMTAHLGAPVDWTVDMTPGSLRTLGDISFIDMETLHLYLSATGDNRIVFDGAGAPRVTVTGGESHDTLIVDWSFLTEDIVDFAETTDAFHVIPFHALMATADGGRIIQFAGIERMEVTGGSGDDRLTGSSGDDTIDGGAGSDRVSYAAALAGVIVDLNFQGAAQDTVAGGMDTLLRIEGVVGSSSDDVLTGDDNDNFFAGGYGADTLAGGAGIDTLSYDDGWSFGVEVDLAAQTSVATDGAPSDIISGFENVIGSMGADSLFGDAGANALRGGFGADFLDGRGGADTIDGGADFDTAVIDLSASPGASDFVFDAAPDIVRFLPGGVSVSNIEALELTLGAGGDNVSYRPLVESELRVSAGAGTDHILIDLTGTSERFFSTIDGEFAPDPIPMADFTAVNGLKAWLTDAKYQVTFEDFESVELRSGSGGAIYIDQDRNDTFIGGDGSDFFGANMQAFLSTGQAAISNASGDDIFFGGGGEDAFQFYYDPNAEGGSTTVDGGGEEPLSDGDYARLNFRDYQGPLTWTFDPTPGAVNTLPGNLTFTNIEALEILLGAFNDHIEVGFGNQVDGAGGDDFIYVGPHAHVDPETSIEGGQGFDTVVLDFSQITQALMMPSFGFVSLIGLVEDPFGIEIQTHFSGVERLELRSGSGDDILDAGAQSLVLRGVTEAALYGNGGDDALSGTGGADMLAGGLGNDELNGRGGADVFVYEAGQDIIGDFEDGSDRIDLTGVDALGGLSAVIARSSQSDENTIIDFGGGHTLTLVGVTLDQLSQGDFIFRNAPPTITSLGGGDTAAMSVLENALGVTTVAASDPDAGQAARYRIAGGADADRFNVDAIAGALTFAQAPDFELPTDADGDGMYEVIVEAYDDEGASDAQTLHVTVDNVAGAAIQGTAGSNTINATQTVPGQPLPTDEEDTINAGGGADTVNALGGNDRIDGGAGGDTLRGGAGDDFIDGGAGNDAMFGGTGNDTFVVNAAGDTVQEGVNEGIDTVLSAVTFALSANVENLTLTGLANIDGTGNALANVIVGNAGRNVLSGGGGGDRLEGDAGADLLNGEGGNDMLLGGAGADRLTGGAGVDVLIGGADADRFVWSNVNHSAPATPDEVTDFERGLDLIDLAAIDARTGTGGNQTFLYGGQNASAVANSVTWYEQGGDTFIQADVNGDTAADFLVKLRGTGHQLAASDFAL